MKDKRSILIGSFDGLHIGHQFLIEEFKKKSEAIGVNPTIFSYEIHPLKILKPNIANYYLDHDLERTERLMSLGSTILCDFNDYKHMKAKEFFEELVLRYSDITHVFMGHDSSFGCDQISDISILETYPTKLIFKRLPKFSKVNVSSTLIRESVNNGNVLEFTKYTNRNFIIKSKVIPGKQLGRTIGFPTANLYVDTERVRLPDGVYYGTVYLDNEKFSFVANIGLRPTVDNDDAMSIEAHILDFEKDIYGKEISLVIQGQLREVIKFNSKDDLMKQIKEDVEKVRSLDA